GRFTTFREALNGGRYDSGQKGWPVVGDRRFQSRRCRGQCDRDSRGKEEGHPGRSSPRLAVPVRWLGDQAFLRRDPQQDRFRWSGSGGGEGGPDYSPIALISTR